MNLCTIPASMRRHAIAAALATVSGAIATPAVAAPRFALGGEFAVNAANVDRDSHASVAMDADGDFVVAWQHRDNGSYEIHAQRFDAAGTRRGREIEVNTQTFGSQTGASVAMDARGDFVVAWETRASTDADVHVRLFNAAGAPLGDEFTANTMTDADQYKPSVAMDAGGAFVVAWVTQFPPAPHAIGIDAQRFDAGGQARGGEFTVDLSSPCEGAPEVAMDARGDFVVAWEAYCGESAQTRARAYGRKGVARGPAFFADRAPGTQQTDPALALDAGGGFVIAWQDGTGTGARIRGRRFGADAAAQGDAFVVSTGTPPDGGGTGIAVDAGGAFVVSWEAANSSDTGILARRYTADATPNGATFRVNRITSSRPLSPAMACDADGDFAVAWTVYYDFTGTPSEDIHAQRFHGSEDVDLAVTQSGNADHLPTGGTLDYTVQVSNLHPAATATGVAAVDRAIGAARTVQIEDRLPAGAAGATLSGTDWTCTAIGSTRTCAYDRPLPAGTSAAPLQVTLMPASTSAVSVRNRVEVSADQADANASNNADTSAIVLP